MGDSSRSGRSASKWQSRIGSLTETEIAWLAGLLEGEGCFSLDRPGGKNSRYRAFRISLASTDQDVIETVHRLTGAGRIETMWATVRAENQKTAYRWALNRRDHVRLLIDRTLPYLHERRRTKASALLTAMKEYEEKKNGHTLF